MKNKRGNISYIFTLMISIGMLFLTIITVINMLTPFIWYQKLENIASKYVYIVEKFGYITNLEKEEMLDELKNDGFDINKITILCPEKRLAYGEGFKFELTYKLNINNIMNGEEVKRETKEVLLHVKKYGYSKI
ncbi:MAG: hypothetical protein IKL68_01390 [Clostridia bacterium]|nr:hypothetical protein [Clostridia bacterium]